MPNLSGLRFSSYQRLAVLQLQLVQVLYLAVFLATAALFVALKADRTIFVAIALHRAVQQAVCLRKVDHKITKKLEQYDRSNIHTNY